MIQRKSTEMLPRRQTHRPHHHLHQKPPVKYLHLKLALYYTLCREIHRGIKERDTALMEMNGQDHFSTSTGETWLWIFYKTVDSLFRAWSVSSLPINLCSQSATINQSCSLFLANWSLTTRPSAPAVVLINWTKWIQTNTQRSYRKTS